MAVAHVKGGLPVRVYGYVNGYGEAVVEYVCWYNTDKEVTPAFRKSLSLSDERALEEAISDEHYYG